jgi:hypothetical protein
MVAAALTCKQKSMLVPFENKAGQSARRVRPGINVDTVRQNFWSLGWGVAMNDPLAKIYFAVEELLANP